MSGKQRRHFTAAQKLAIVKQHLVDNVPISDLCEKHQILATQFYQWQKQLFENGAAAHPMTLPTREGHHLIAVRLAEDEEVCISFKHLFAFSEQVNFRSVLDLSVASWAIDRAFQHLCTGPGLVVFECAGVPKV